MTPEEIEKEILEELFDNGDLVDCDLERIFKRREGIISERIKEYTSGKLKYYKKTMARRLTDLVSRVQYLTEDIKKTRNGIL